MCLDPITLYNVLARLPMWVSNNVSDRSTCMSEWKLLKKIVMGEGGRGLPGIYDVYDRVM